MEFLEIRAHNARGYGMNLFTNYIYKQYQDSTSLYFACEIDCGEAGKNLSKKHRADLRAELESYLKIKKNSRRKFEN